MRGRADLGSGTLPRDASPRRVMNGPADGEVDYKKKYRNLKRKLKFLIYVSAGVGRLWSVRPSFERTSVYPCGKGGKERCLRILGLLRIALGSAPALSATGTRVLSGGAQKGAKEIVEGFTRQEVRHVVDTRAMLLLGILVLTSILE